MCVSVLPALAIIICAQKRPHSRGVTSQKLHLHKCSQRKTRGKLLRVPRAIDLSFSVVILSLAPARRSRHPQSDWPTSAHASKREGRGSPKTVQGPYKREGLFSPSHLQHHPASPRTADFPSYCTDHGHHQQSSAATTGREADDKGYN